MCEKLGSKDGGPYVGYLFLKITLQKTTSFLGMRKVGRHDKLKEWHLYIVKIVIFVWYIFNMYIKYITETYI